MKNYVIISAFELILLSVSNQSIVISSAPYPPFGLATVAFLALSMYFIFIGIYGSALSVSQDLDLRKTIRRVAVDQPQTP